MLELRWNCFSVFTLVLEGTSAATNTHFLMMSSSVAMVGCFHKVRTVIETHSHLARYYLTGRYNIIITVLCCGIMLKMTAPAVRKELSG